MMNALIQILKVGPLQDKSYEGRAYQVQEAECLLLSDAGEVESVGVLRLSKDFQKDPPATGTYTAKFALALSPKDRRIGAQLVGLTAVPPNAIRRAADAPKVAA